MASSGSRKWPRRSVLTPTLLRALSGRPEWAVLAFAATAVGLTLDPDGRIWLPAKRCVGPRRP